MDKIIKQTINNYLDYISTGDIDLYYQARNKIKYLYPSASYVHQERLKEVLSHVGQNKKATRDDIEYCISLLRTIL